MKKRLLVLGSSFLMLFTVIAVAIPTPHAQAASLPCLPGFSIDGAGSSNNHNPKGSSTQITCSELETALQTGGLNWVNAGEIDLTIGSLTLKFVDGNRAYEDSQKNIKEWQFTVQGYGCYKSYVYADGT